MHEKVFPAVQAAAPAVEVRERYRPRAASFLGHWTSDDWTLKAYGLKYRGDKPSAETVDAARQFVADTLPSPARTTSRYGIGFTVVHEGQDMRWLLVDWWGHESVLHHTLYMAELTGPPEFVAAGDHLTACVWELPILQFERDAWVEHVLTPERPDPAAYLDRWFEGAI